VFFVLCYNHLPFGDARVTHLPSRRSTNNTNDRESAARQDLVHLEELMSKNELHDMQNHLRELRQHLRVLSRALALIGSDDADAAAYLRGLLQILHEEMRYPHVVIGFTDADGVMRPLCSYGFSNEIQEQLMAVPEQGIVGWVMAHAKSLRVGDTRTDPRYCAALETTRSEMCAPILVSDGRVIGVIDVESHKVNAFTTQDIFLAETLANAVSHTLERLIKERQARARSRTKTRLTRRETQALGAAAAGQGNKEIARTLHISENTVETHLRHCYQKLSVTSRGEAVTKARALGLLEEK